MKTTPLRTICAALLALCAVPARAEAPLTPAQVLDYQRPADLHFSPDGRKLAYVVLSYNWDWAPHLCVLDLASGAVAELTPKGKAEKSPQWSPDGRTLAFLSNRGGKTQVYAMPVDGGTPTALTARKNGVTAFHWAADGHAIAYLAKADDAPDDDSGPQLADDARKRAQLWLLDLTTHTSHALAADGYRIDEFQWQSPSALLLVATDTPRVEELNTAVYRLSTAGGPLVLVTKPPQPFEHLVVAPGGAMYGFNAPRHDGPVAQDLYLAAGEGAPLDRTAALDRTVLESHWTSPSTIWVRIADGFNNRLYRLDDKTAVPLNLPLSVASFDVAPDGAIAYAGEDFAHLPQIYLRRPDGTIRQIVHLVQGQVADRLAPVAIFRTDSFDGTPIEAALMTPPGRPRKYPLVLLVHGGPSSNFSAAYSWEAAWAQLLASHGTAVLMVNPRGSRGYGEQFAGANRADWGGGDYKDLLAVLDAVIARGQADPARLGIGGWSYGGEMAEWAIGHSDRFKAAVAGAGVFDQAAEYETEDDPSGDAWYFGTPWENADVLARNSPSTFIRNAHTPTLILDGEDDTSNPVGQSKGLYRALKHFRVDSTLVTYPGEGHSPRKGANNIDMFQRILDWYGRYLR